MSFKNTVLVTGASSGIGLATCELLAQKKIDLIGVDKNLFSENKASFENEVNFYQLDISNFEQIKTLSNSLDKKGIKLGGIVNNAAIQIESPLIEMKVESWDEIIRTNLSAPFYIVKALFPLLEKKSSIVNISSVHAQATSPGLAAYAASKGALSSLTRAMALEFASHEIRVNSISPGAIQTDMLEKGLSRNGDSGEMKNYLINRTPLKRIGASSDVADMVDFLLSEKSKFITGQNFVVDGGVTAQLPSE